MKKSIKIIALAALAATAIVGLTGCTSPTYQHMSGNRVTAGSDIQTFHKAIISVGDTTIDGSVVQWRDYDNSDTVQVMLDDGKTYLTHYTNVLLIADPKLGIGYSSGIADYN